MAALRSVWCVHDPTSISTLADVLFEATPLFLQRWVIGGQRDGDRGRVDESLTFYADEAEARRDAQARIDARRAYDEALRAAKGTA